MKEEEEEQRNYGKGKRMLKETSCGNGGIVEKSHDFSTIPLKTLRVSNISTRVIQEQASLWMLYFFFNNS